MKKITTILFITSAILLAVGCYKMFVYVNPEDSFEGEPKNAYVGGDAYNYIINANYATSYFVLSMFAALLGITVLIHDEIRSQNSINRNINFVKRITETEEKNFIEELEHEIMMLNKYGHKIMQIEIKDQRGYTDHRKEAYIMIAN